MNHPPHAAALQPAITRLDDVSARIDRIDREIVGLLARRGEWVRQAARFKKDSREVRAPDRVEQVVAGAKARALELGADPEVVEQVYRTMLAAYVDSELKLYAALRVGEG